MRLGKRRLFLDFIEENNQSEYANKRGNCCENMISFDPMIDCKTTKTYHLQRSNSNFIVLSSFSKPNDKGTCY